MSDAQIANGAMKLLSHSPFTAATTVSTRKNVPINSTMYLFMEKEKRAKKLVLCSLYLVFLLDKAKVFA